MRAEDLDERLQLVKRFDLKASPLEETAEDADFPRWVSPRLEVYAAEPPSRVVTPLALERPGVGLGQGFAMVYGDYAAYGLGEGGMWIGGGGMAQRVLRLGRTPARLGISLANQGQDLAVAVVSQGPWPGTRVVLYPGQELDLPLATRAWPPWLAGFFPVKVSLPEGKWFGAALSGPEPAGAEATTPAGGRKVRGGPEDHTGAGAIGRGQVSSSVRVETEPQAAWGTGRTGWAITPLVCTACRRYWERRFG